MRRPWIGIGLGLLLAGLLGLVAWSMQARSPAEERLRTLAGLLPSAELTTETARRGLLQQLPRGTDAQNVYAFLDQHGIGSDGRSSYHPADATGRIVCRLEYDPASFGLVKESFGVFFILDATKRLENIEVERWLTGP